MKKRLAVSGARRLVSSATSAKRTALAAAFGPYEIEAFFDPSQLAPPRGFRFLGTLPGIRLLLG